MKTRFASAILWTVSAGLVLGGTASLATAGPMPSSHNPSFLKVFRVFGDDDQGGDAAAVGRSPRRSHSSKGRRRSRSGRVRLAPVAPAAEPENGILDLIDPCASSSLEREGQKNARRAQSPLTVLLQAVAISGEEPGR